ncbi:MAG: hypothetical protein IKT43_03300 [Clostridia bacterium]|nr:hypothetical protein [Clostridia bacterium]
MANREQGTSRLRAVNRNLTKSGAQTRYVAVRTIRTDNYVLETRVDPIRKPFPYAVIFAIVAIVAVAMYVLSLRITLDGLTADISRMEREIAASREEQNALEVRLGAKYDLTEIERIAKDEYGMVSKDSLSKKYISISGEDQIEVFYR